MVPKTVQILRNSKLLCMCRKVTISLFQDTMFMPSIPKVGRHRHSERMVTGSVKYMKIPLKRSRELILAENS